MRRMVHRELGMVPGQLDQQSNDRDEHRDHPDECSGEEARAERALHDSVPMRYPSPRTVSIVDGAELPPQTRDEHFDGVRVAVERLRVDVLGQLGLRNDAAAMVHEVREHAKLMTGQLHRLPIESDLRRSRVQHHVRRTAARA